MTVRTFDAALGRWRGILTQLGVNEKYLKREHGPCPICRDGKDRFRFDDIEGRGTFYCTSCGPGTGMTLIQKYHGWDFKTAAAEVDRIVGNVAMEQQREEQTEEQKMARIKQVLKEARRIQVGDPVWEYLNRRCGPLDPTRVLGLRYHPGLYHPEAGEKLPCMLAMMVYADGTGASVHRTFLTPDGQKAKVQSVRRIMPGKPIPGSSVRLGGEWHTVVLAEGIETALCASARFLLPAFAAISSEGMKSWVPPAYVKKVLVCGDNDANYTGQAAAYEAARTLVLQHKLEVEVHIPEDKGKDWCDLHKTV